MRECHRNPAQKAGMHKESGNRKSSVSVIKSVTPSVSHLLSITPAQGLGTGQFGTGITQNNPE